MMGYMTAKAAARSLGVSLDLLEGLVHAKKVDGIVKPGRTGRPVVLIRNEELPRLRALIG